MSRPVDGPRDLHIDSPDRRRWRWATSAASRRRWRFGRARVVLRPPLTAATAQLDGVGASPSFDRFKDPG
jgi:hypothetical protein